MVDIGLFPVYGELCIWGGPVLIRLCFHFLVFSRSVRVAIELWVGHIVKRCSDGWKRVGAVVVYGEMRCLRALLWQVCRALGPFLGQV